MRRRVLGVLTALVFFATMLQPLPALAAPPLLDVITLDPLAPSSNSQTGTTPFDATSFDPVALTNPGTDSSGTNHIVRTNDIISYDFQYNVNSAPGLNITLTSTLGTYLGQPVANWTGVPAGCGAGSAISNAGQTLTCVIGAVAQGTAQDIVATAKVIVSAPNGATITPSVTIDDPGNVGTIPVTNTGYWLNQSQQAPTTYDTITSVAKYNAMKQSTSAKPVIEPYTYFGEGGVQGYYIDFPVLVREGDGSAVGQFGIAPAPSPITITDTLTPGLNAILPAANACGINGAGITLQNEPYGAIGVVGAATAVNSVINSGTITCTQSGGAGTPVTITITGADTSGASFPVNKAGSAGIDNLTYVVAGYMRLWVPDTAGNLGAVGNNQGFTDTYTGIDPGNPNELPANLTATTTLTAKGPAGASGSAGKIFVQTTAENGFPFNNSHGPALTSGAAIVSVFAFNNTSTAASGLVTVNNFVACDTIDTTNILVTPFSGAPGFPTDTHWGGAVHLSGINGGSFTDIAPPPGFTVSYGDATTAADCSSGTFYASATDPNFTAGNPIVHVKFTLTALTPGQQLRVQLSETVNPGLVAGTIVHNTVSATGTSSTTGPGYSESASTTGEIFTTNLAVTKYLYKTTAGAAVFNANGAHAPSAAGNSSGSAGAVDTNQEFVSFLDDDGSQGTLPSNSVVTCDIVPPNTAVKDFDGITGPAVATYGGPVTFATISGSTPASYLVEYSTVPTFGGDTCTDAPANWSSTPPSPRSTITRVRATFNLPAVSRIRMLLNLQVNPVVAPGTIITNSMVTTVGGVNPLTATQSVTVEPETVSVTKTGPVGSVMAGSPAGFSIQGYVQGAGSPQSGLVAVTDTLPTGLTYIPNSTVLTAPPNPTTWVAGSDSATPVITVNGSNQQVLTWTLGTATASPGVFIQLPTVAFQTNTDISLPGGTLVNSVTIADPNDGNPGGPNHTATASVTISNPGAFHISKTTSTPQIATGGTITWQLNYANTGSTPATSTDFIDILPYTGDSRGSSFHGTIALATAAGTNGETVEYTNASPGAINEDPGCTSNGGVVSPPTGGCQNFAATTWCPALSGGACPASLAQVTGIRILGGALPGPSGTRTVTVTATTSGNLFTDQYWNSFGARTSILALGVHSPPVETIVPTPPVPFVTLVKSCLAPPTCTAAAQAPGTDITYGIAATNTGGHVAALVTITDPIPANMDFKVGTASDTVPAGASMTITYSADGVNYTYTPVSAGGGAATGYDRNVVAVRWTLATGSLGTSGPGAVCNVQFTAAIR
jgi:uncharacterized repeat protein (TIGR01451 family)